jgi:hypothetical protein
MSRECAQISSRTFLIPGNSSFQNWSESFPSNARSMQLALKFVF